MLSYLTQNDGLHDSARVSPHEGRAASRRPSQHPHDVIRAESYGRVYACPSLCIRTHTLAESTKNRNSYIVL